MKNTLFTLVFAAISMIAFAQWSNNPAENNRITPLATEIYDHDLKVAGNGTTFVVFNRPIGGNTATFIQIIDVNGNMLFSDQGKLISNKQTLSWIMAGEILFLDADGNALVVVTDCRNSPGIDISYTLYKVSQTGEMLWGENGVDLCSGMAYGLVADIKIVQLEDGSYVCAWMVEEGNVYIQLQRISQNGELLWNGTETRIYESSASNEYPYLVNSDDNNIIVVYYRGPSVFNKALKARKLNINGAAVWANDLTVFNGNFGYTPAWVVVRAISDQMGGAFVGWFDDRNNTWIESTYVAHVKTNGTHGFPTGDAGLKVGHSSLRSFYPEMYFNAAEGFLYVTWRETNDTQSWQQLVAQKIKVSSSELLWGNNGKIISPYTYNHSLAFYSIQSEKNGNVAVFFTSNTWHPEYLYGWDINNITLLNSNGEYVWNEEIIQFSTPVGFKGRLVSSPLVFNNYWLTAWNDERKIEGDPGGSKKIYVQRINFDGTLGDNGVVVCLPPTNVKAELQVGCCCSALITWNGVAEDYELEYRFEDGLAKVVEVIGAHSYTLENLEADKVYYVKVRSICSEGVYSDWSETKSFHTGNDITPCDVPVNLTVTEITTISAVLSWTASLGNTRWDLRYREASDTSWININDIEETSYFLQELIPNTFYLWSVRAFCYSPTNSVYSEWAPQGSFTTQQWGINEGNKNLMNVFASGKMLNIINPENRYIENIQMFDITGKLITEYKINSNENVLIPTNLSSTTMVFVRIAMQNGIENHKIVIP